MGVQTGINGAVGLVTSVVGGVIGSALSGTVTSVLGGVATAVGGAFSAMCSAAEGATGWIDDAVA